MKFVDLLSSEIRKENFGGIIYFPSYNTQLAINDDLYQLVKLIKGEKSPQEAIRTITQNYNLDKESAKKILDDCLIILTKDIENYVENHDDDSDWQASKQNNGTIHLSAPLMVIVEVTKKCNQKCKFCYQATEETDVLELPNKLLRKIIDQAEEMGVFKIQYIGGEPLCRKDFIDILSYTSEKGIFVSFTSNGVYIDRVIDRLREIKRLLPIQVSIHGDSEEFINQYEIGLKEWKKTIANCRLLKKYNLPFGIKTVISRLNYKNLLRSVEMFNQIGAKTVTFLHLLPIGGGKNMQDAVKFTEKEVWEIVESISLAKIAFPGIYLDYRLFLNTYFPKRPKTKLDKFFNCPAGSLDLRIRYDGKVLQCSSLRIPIDDTKQNDLRRIWTSISGKMLPCPYECNQVFQCIQNY